MARGPEYSAEEDAIILSMAGQPGEATRDRLIEAGFPRRSTAALKARRHHLKMMEDYRSWDLGELLERQRLLETRIETIREEAERLDERLMQIRHAAARKAEEYAKEFN